MTPHHVDGLAIGEYHRHDAVSSTQIRKALRSIAHMLAPDDHDSKALRIGSAVHTLVLEPETFGGAFAVAPDCDRRTKEGKTTFAAFEAAAGSRVVLSQDEHETARRTAAALQSHPFAARFLDGAVAERSFFWIDEETGLPCRCRPDVFRETSMGIRLGDVKTCQDASPDAFKRDLAKWSYHVQAAHYLAGVEAVTGTRPDWFVFLAAETVEPHGAAPYALDDETIARGEAARRRALGLIADYRRGTLQHIGYPIDPQIISAPAWAA